MQIYCFCQVKAAYFWMVLKISVDQKVFDRIVTAYQISRDLLICFSKNTSSEISAAVEVHLILQSTVILQDPFKCCFQPLSSNRHRPLSILAKSVCRSYPNRPCSFLRTFPFLIHSFNLLLLRLCSVPGTLLGTEDTAAYKTDKNLCFIVQSEISRRKTDTV